MLAGFYSMATGMRASEQLHDVIAENLANVSVPGYRGQVLTHETFEEAMQGALDSPSPEGHGTLVSQISSDFTPGPTAHTGRTLDVAIGGGGFFEVAGPEGPLYTRNGVFFLNQQSQLVNSDGMPLQGEGGPITVPGNLSTERIHIAQDGSVSGDGAVFGKLRVVQFDDPNQLERKGNTLFAAPPGVNGVPSEASIMQGVREMSNVSAVGEMVRMIWASRHYEAAQRAMKTLDQAIGQVTDPRA
jgi:flagellar basal-body rod protein FlgF